MPDALPGVAFRPMVAADVHAATYVRKAALEGLLRSQGREPDAWMPRRSVIVEHLLQTDPGGSWVAEMDGMLVGYAQGLVRGDIWFLAQLFVQPDVHAHGAGQGLLQRAQEYGRSRNVRVFSVVSSTSPAAQALYMRHNMFGVAIGYQVSGPLEGLRELPRAKQGEIRAVDAGSQDAIAGIDQAVWGAERREEHALLASAAFGSTDTAFVLERDGRVAGYAHTTDYNGGWIGPLAAYQPDDQLPLIRAAANWMAEREITNAGAYCLSSNPVALGTFLNAGWKIGGWTFLLASERFGQFDRYLPLGGALL